MIRGTPLVHRFFRHIRPPDIMPKNLGGGVLGNQNRGKSCLIIDTLHCAWWMRGLLESWRLAFPSWATWRSISNFVSVWLFLRIVRYIISYASIIEEMYYLTRGRTLTLIGMICKLETVRILLSRVQVPKGGMWGRCLMRWREQWVNLGMIWLIACGRSTCDVDVDGWHV